jgi:hypothetical protein
MTAVKPRLCLQCGKPILHARRRDKLFCNDECRDDYHNAVKFANSQEIKLIQAILRRNRSILKALLGDKPEVIVAREILLKKGFEFDYHTHHVISKTKRHEYVFTFNYGYWAMPGEQHKVVKSFG